MLVNTKNSLTVKNPQDAFLSPGPLLVWWPEGRASGAFGLEPCLCRVAASVSAEAPAPGTGRPVRQVPRSAVGPCRTPSPGGPERKGEGVVLAAVQKPSSAGE